MDKNKIQITTMCPNCDAHIFYTSDKIKGNEIKCGSCSFEFNDYDTMIIWNKDIIDMLKEKLESELIKSPYDSTHFIPDKVYKKLTMQKEEKEVITTCPYCQTTNKYKTNGESKTVICYNCEKRYDDNLVNKSTVIEGDESKIETIDNNFGNTQQNIDSSGWYKAIAWICGIISGIIIWLYSFSEWGFLLGLIFGWIPAIIGGIIAGILWPLIAIIILYALLTG